MKQLLSFILSKSHFLFAGYSLCSPSFHSPTALSCDSSGESDELRLTLTYENESSKNLPTKIQLEICDASTGRVVFRKRQNIYYVKLQEKLASLNSAEDYVLTVTSITGREKAEEKVTIHNKYYIPDEVVTPDDCKFIFSYLFYLMHKMRGLTYITSLHYLPYSNFRYNRRL